jgi:restriction system protein
MSFFSFDNPDPAQFENARQKIYLLVNEHMETLIKKRKNGIKTDDYGNVDATKWIKETQTFVDKMFVPRLTPGEAKAVKSHGLSKFATTYIEDPVRSQSFYKRIQSERQKPSIPLTPIKYEEYCAKLISNQGWICEATKVTGDQGADIKAKKNGKVLVVQCKQYSSSVGNAAVQEVIAARGFYGAHYAVVVTNSTYTKSAMELAKRTGVILLNHDEISELDRRISLSITQ